MKKVNLLRGLSAVMAFLFITMSGLTSIAGTYKMLINDYFGLTTQNSFGFRGTEYGDASGNPTEEGYWKLIADSYRYCEEQEENGAVLLYNKDNALPLANAERNISLFGKNSTDPIYRSGAGGPIANLEYQKDFYDSFKNAGFSINDTLYDAYKSYNRRANNQDIKRSASDVGEADPAFYDLPGIRASFDSNNDVAIVVLARYGSEGSDLSLNTNNGQHLLELDKYEAEMFKIIKDSGKFKKTIVLLNGSFPMELDWIKDPQYGVDAVLWIGNPGYYGLPGVVNILTGAANPSGHAMEMFAADSTSSPAMQNFGDIDYDIGSYPENDPIIADSRKYVVYKEGIYVGYKYYETRYEDVILNQGNANSTAGAFKSADGWNYADEVCYPFGFGLSYTDFDYRFDGIDYNAAKDVLTATVTVKNIGNVAGKASAQIYAQSPYTEYDKTNKVEKAAVQLMNYEKIELQPGESKTVKIDFDKYFLASYDEYNQKGYIFEPGDYYFGVGNGSHEAMNAILAYKGASGLTDHDGNAVDSQKAKTCAVMWTAPNKTIDTTTYQMSRYNEAQEVTNIFDDCDLNYWANEEDKVSYLTRNDWDGTWPTKALDVTINEGMYRGLKMNNYEKPADAPSVADVPTGVKLDEKITFAQMVGVAYDDPMWDTFISQLSLDDLAISVSDYRGIGAVVSIRKPASSVAEGPEGMLATFNYGDKRHTTGFATLPLVASTFDHEMQIKHGHMYGEEALFAGVAMVNGPGTNIVRTPYLGRTSEYFSEDGMLSYYCAAHVVGGMMDRGCVGNIKHCFLNNQETNRQKVSTFSQEQPMREIYGRGWEGAFTLGHGMGVMTAYNRIGLTYTASSVALNDTLFRKEWNYQGSIIDDAMAQSNYSNAGDMLQAGTNLFCLDGARGQYIVDQIRENDDGNLLQMLQRANKRLLYALTHSFLGGISEDTEVDNGLTWWEMTIIGVDAAIGAIALCMAGCYMYAEYGAKKETKEKKVEQL